MEKLKEWIHKICEILEMLIAIVVLFGIILALLSIFKNHTIFQELLNSTDALKHYLDEALILVIGIEFLQMLCRPNSDNVIEVIIFLVARHMIVSDTTPNQDFVSVISIALLCFVRQYLHRSGLEEKDEEKDDETIQKS